MKSWINDIVVQGLSLLSVPSLVLWGAAYVPDAILIILSVVFAAAGAVCFFIKKKHLGISLVIVAAIVIGLLVINKTHEKSNREFIVARNDDYIIRKVFQADSAHWRLYEERNPDILAELAVLLLDAAINDKKDGGIRYLDLAERLLKEAANGGAWRAYWGYAYMYSNGLGSKTYERLAVDNLKRSLAIEETPEAFSLLEQINLDSATYPEEYSRVHQWRQEYDNYVFEVNSDLRVITSSYDSNAMEGSIVDWKGYHILDSLYRGDTSAVCWKMLNKHIGILRRQDMRNNIIPLYLTGYYYGRGMIDSSQFFYDITYQQKTTGFWILPYGTFHGVHEFNLNGDFLPVLKYSAANLLQFLADTFQSGYDEYPYLSLAFREASVLKLAIDKNNIISQEVKNRRWKLIKKEQPVITSKNHTENYRGTGIEIPLRNGLYSSL